MAIKLLPRIGGRGTRCQRPKNARAASVQRPVVFDGPADVFFSVEKFLWGRETHDGIAYTVGSTWYFNFSEPQP